MDKLTIREAQAQCQPFSEMDPLLDAAYKMLALSGEVSELHEMIVALSALRLSASLAKLQNREVKVSRGTMSRIKEDIGRELADVLIYVFLYANVEKIDVETCLKEKLRIVMERKKAGYYGCDQPGESR